MLFAIELDHETLLDAAEIDDKWSNWMLATKFEIAQLAVAQTGPQAPLRIGRRFPHFTSVAD
jgi:hypothetical protein